MLYRVNAQSEVYEQALAEAQIPYQVRGGERFFARPEIRQAMVSLRAAVNGAPEAELPMVVREVLKPHGLSLEPPTGGAQRERWESLLALVELAEELDTTVPGARSGARSSRELEMRADAQHAPTVEGVTLASLHAAKGLEWDAVFLVGLTDGTMPIQHADSDEAAIEEERRLLYVGVTRAREHLWLSWSLSRTAGGRRHRRRSRFLYGLLPEDHPAARSVGGMHREAASTRRTIRVECRVCGDALVSTPAIKLGRCATCPSDVDEELLARLKQWRAARAKQLRVPPYVVFTDTTLTAIAEQRPLDTSGLVAISGIGPSKLDKYGADVIALVQGDTGAGQT